MKIFALLLVMFAGLSYAADEQLTLLSPKNGQLQSGTSDVSWAEEYEVLTSWKISFTLSSSTDVSDTLFYGAYGNYERYGDCISLYLNNEGKISILSGSNTLYTSSTSWVRANNLTDVSLQFVTLLDSANRISGGEVSVKVGDNSVNLELDSSVVQSSYLYNCSDYPKAQINSVINFVQYRDIQLYKLDDRLLIPEPTTSTMSLLALAALATRRRRR